MRARWSRIGRVGRAERTGRPRGRERVELHGSELELAQAGGRRPPCSSRCAPRPRRGRAAAGRSARRRGGGGARSRPGARALVIAGPRPLVRRSSIGLPPAPMSGFLGVLALEGLELAPLGRARPASSSTALESSCHLLVDLAHAGAGMAGSLIGAVVLAGRGDAVALDPFGRLSGAEFRGSYCPMGNL